MRHALSVVGSSIGKKIIMAATGIILVVFVVGHMTGNLLIFMGEEALNEYGEFLHEFLHGQGIWIARIGLLTAVVLHIWAAVSLANANRTARPQGYRKSQHLASDYASRTMIWSGPILALFIIYHLLHFTTGQAHSEFIYGDVYHNVVTAFQNVAVSGFYILAMLALGLHMRHGIWSMIQTLGGNHPRYNPWFRGIATVLTAIVVLGNISIPVAVLTGFVR